MTLENKLQVAESLRQTLQQQAKQNKQDWWKQVARTQELLQDFSTACVSLEKSVNDLVERNNCEIILSVLDSIYASAVSGVELDFKAEVDELNKYIAHSTTYVKATSRGVKLQADVQFDSKTLIGKAKTDWPEKMKAYEENIEQLRELRGHVSDVESGRTRIPGAMYVLGVMTKMTKGTPLYSPAGAFLGDGKWDPVLRRQNGIAVSAEVKTGLFARPLQMNCEYSQLSVELSLSPSARKERLIGRAEAARRNRQLLVDCIVVDNMSRAGINTLFTHFEHPNYLLFGWNFRDEELIYNQGDARTKLFKHYFDPTSETDGLRAYVDDFKETAGDSLLSLGSGDSVSFSMQRLHQALRLPEGDVTKLLARVYGRKVDVSGDTLTLAEQ